MIRLLAALVLCMPLQAASQLIPYREGGEYYEPEPPERYREPRYPNNDGPSFGTIPRSSSDQNAQCDAAYREYRVSQDCFNRFRNAYGAGVRGDAYRYCREVPDPSPQCGPPRNW